MLEELVNKNREQLNSTDMMIWKYVYNHQKECKSYSINELAEKCNVSRTTVLRFTKKLSFSGYSQFKSALNFENFNQEETEEINTKEIVNSYESIISDLQKKNWNGINELIDQADYLFGYATGDVQNNLLSEIKREFNSIGKFVVDMGADNEANSLVDLLPPKSAVIIISFSGENPKALNLARKLKLLDIPTLSITSLSDNTLASLTNENLYIRTPQRLINSSTNKKSHLIAGFFIGIEMMLANYLTYKNK